MLRNLLRCADLSFQYHVRENYFPPEARLSVRIVIKYGIRVNVFSLSYSYTLYIIPINSSF